jgi:hypothetical protein
MTSRAWSPPPRPPRGRRRRLGDDHQAVALHVEALDRVLGDGLGRDDDAGRPLDGHVAQLEAHAGAQVLAAALERDEVVERDDLRAGAAHAHPVDPRRVEDVGAARPVALDDLVAVRRLAQRLEQAAGIAADATRVARRPAVERDPHAAMSCSTRSA